MEQESFARVVLQKGPALLRQPRDGGSARGDGRRSASHEAKCVGVVGGGHGSGIATAYPRV